MENFEINTNDIDWKDPNINARHVLAALPNKKEEPVIDMVVSQIVGRPIYQTDPRLIKLIVKWKNQTKKDPKEPYNFFADRKKIEELKFVLSK